MLRAIAARIWAGSSSVFVMLQFYHTSMTNLQICNTSTWPNSFLRPASLHYSCHPYASHSGHDTHPVGEPRWGYVVAHQNAPLTPAGRRRLCERVDSGRPIAHVAAEAGISRKCLAKWYARWQADGPVGLLDRTSAPDSSPGRTAADVEDLVEKLRRETKFGAARRTNGKVERFNGTLAREWAYVREYESEAHRRAALVEFLNDYNYVRPHSAIGNKPPASRVPLATYRLTAEGITVVELPQPFEQMSIDDILA
jgi:hypothetical protein